MGSVSELARVVNGPAAGHFREAVLWVPRMKVSMQAINDRLRVLPAHLFKSVLTEVLPVLRARWEERQQPVPAVMAQPLKGPHGRSGPLWRG